MCAYSLARLNWLAKAPLEPAGRAVTVKLRSAQEAVPARVYPLSDGGEGEGGVELLLDAPQHGVAPGQAAVLYDGSRLLGGGWITGAALARAA